MAEILRLGQRFRALIENEGLGATVSRAADKLLVYASYPLKKQSLRNAQFRFGGGTFSYFCHHYNATWRNERSVEISLALDKLRKHAGSKTLEVGNVMSYYARVEHPVVDKYEVALGVQNVDIVDFDSGMKYDFILSISTLEHVGWDETPREPGKFLKSYKHLQSLLAPGGELFVTVPLGHNPHLDELLARGDLATSRVAYLKKVSRKDWREATTEEVKGSRYNAPFPAANAIAVISYVAN